MRIPVILLTAGLLLTTLAVAPAAEANHRCYTWGSYQVCRYIPFDEIPEEILDELRNPDGCIDVDEGPFCLP